LPCIRVDALLEGWYADPVVLDCRSCRPGGLTCRVELRSRPTWSVAVLDDDDRPIANATIRFNLLETFPSHAAFDMDYDRISGFATSGWGHTGGPFYVRHWRGGTTNAEGRTRFTVARDYEIQIAVYAPGFLPLRRLLGRVSQDRWDRLSLQRTPATRVQFLEAGSPLSNRHFLVGDVTELKSQSAFELRSDANGDVSGEWFEMGRIYSITDGQFRGVRLWKGERRVDLATLPATYADWVRIGGR